MTRARVEDFYLYSGWPIECSTAELRSKIAVSKFIGTLQSGRQTWTM
jgi:hypothetical protein